MSVPTSEEKEKVRLREIDIQKHTHQERQCEEEKLWWSLLAERCAMKNFRVFLCAMCYLNSHTSLSRKANI